MAPKKKPNPRSQYWEAIRVQKIESLRWCLRHGGITISAEDDDGHTGIQLAAAGGLTNVLEVMLEFVKKGLGTQDDVEEPDEDGRTPLMMACYNGKFEAVRMLVKDGKAKLDTKCEAGKTAATYAQERKHADIVEYLKNPKAWKPPPEPEDEEDEEDEQKKRVFKASLKLAGASSVNKQEEVHKAKVEAAEALERDLAAAEKPVWPEIGPVIAETRRELSLKGKPPLEGARGPIDPALWGCVCLYELRLEIADRALTSLPAQVSRLTDLVTLIVSGNALAALPAELAKLKKLKNLEAADNALAELPDGLAECQKLQVVDVSSNKIASLSPLSELTELVAINAGNNLLTQLPLKWPSLEHMRTLASPKNKIKVFPPGIGNLQMLESLDLAENAIEQVPIELGNLTVKKLMAVKLKGNPLADARIRRFVEDDTPTLVKDLLNHVRKNGFKGEVASGKGKGKGKGKAKAKAEKVESEDDADGDASIAELLAAMGGGSESDDEDGKKAVNVS